MQQEMTQHYKKKIEDFDRLPGIMHYTTSADTGLFVRQDLQKIADASVKKLGKGYSKMTDVEKKNLLFKLKAEEEMKAIKKKLNFEDGGDKVSKLKREIVEMDRALERNQKNKSFSIIQDLVNAEVVKHEKAMEEEKQAAYIERIQKDNRDRKRIQTGATIFQGQNGKDMQVMIERDPTSKQKQEYKRHFVRLQIFLQFYKEKLMLTKKVQDSLGKHVVTIDALKKHKEGYTD